MKRIVALFISLSLMAALSSCGGAERDAGTDDQNTGSVSVEAGIESETDAEADMPDREDAGNAAEKEEEPEMAEKTENGQTNLLGGLSPEDALEYGSDIIGLNQKEPNSKGDAEFSPVLILSWGGT